MSKAILILDEMPTKCGDCQLAHDYMNSCCLGCDGIDDTNPNNEHDGLLGVYSADEIRKLEIYEKKPSWCPFVEMPEPMYPQGGVYPVYDQGVMDGWNACLKQIGGME